MAEALYVVEGDFTNEGQAVPGRHFVAFRPVRNTGHTPLRMGASYSSSGRNAPRNEATFVIAEKAA